MTNSNYDKKDGNVFTNFLQATGGLITSAALGAWEFAQKNIFPAVRKGADWVVNDGLPAAGNGLKGAADWLGNQFNNITKSFKENKSQQQSSVQPVSYTPTSTETPTIIVEAPTTPVVQNRSHGQSIS